MEQYTGTILISALDHVPEDYLLCNGQLLPVLDYYPLFELPGTRHGGDSATTFGLPVIPAEPGLVFLMCVNGRQNRPGVLQP